MKSKLGVVALCVSIGCSAFSETDLEVEVVGSVGQVREMLDAAILQFLPLSPPSESPYIHASNVVLPVDWSSADWPDSVKKQMYAEMVPGMSEGSLFPIYRLVALEDFWTGEAVLYNSFGVEVLRLPATKDYNPYAWALDWFGVGSAMELTPLQ